MRVGFVALISVLLTTAAHADNEGAEKYRSWLPSQIRDLPEETRKSQVPMNYVMAANTASSPIGDIVIQSNLNMLMYDGIGNIDSAKRRFQIDLGDTPTGNLTVGQISTLFYRAERTRLTQVNFFPFSFEGSISPDIASVKGTAKILDDQIAYPVNFVEIECYRIDLICTYRQTVLVLPNENSWTQSYSVMVAVDETYRITRWDEDRIDALPVQEGGCRINELKLNFAAKEFYEFVTNAPDGNCELPLGGTLPRLQRPRITQIVDGDPIVDEEFKKISKETYQFLSSDFRARVDGIPSVSTDK